MKKKYVALLLVSVFLFLLLPAGVKAEEYPAVYGDTVYPAVYDSTALMDAAWVQQAELIAENVRVLYGVDLHIDILQDISSYTPEEYAELLYVSGSYGKAETFAAESGLSLLLYVPAVSEGNVEWGGYAFCMGGLAKQVFGEAELAAIGTVLEAYLQDVNFAGDGASDVAALTAAADAFLCEAELILQQRGENLQAVALPTAYVDDRAYLLDEDEIAHLNEWGLQLAAQYGCGVYAITLPDMASLGFDDSFYCAIDLYQTEALGIGEGQNGILLLLSMAERDFAIAVYGPLASAAFTDYGMVLLENEFLDDFGDDYWYGGFYDYYDYCEYLLQCHAAGEPVDETYDYDYDYDYDYGYDDGYGEESAGFEIGMLLAMLVGFPCVVALIVCLLFRLQLRSTGRKRQAAQYVTPGGVHITQRWDHFTHRTETRHKIESSSSSSGGSRSSCSSSSRSSGGFSGRSGKF